MDFSVSASCPGFSVVSSAVEMDSFVWAMGSSSAMERGFFVLAVDSFDAVGRGFFALVMGSSDAVEMDSVFLEIYFDFYCDISSGQEIFVFYDHWEIYFCSDCAFFLEKAVAPCCLEEELVQVVDFFVAFLIHPGGTSPSPLSFSLALDYLSAGLRLTSPSLCALSAQQETPLSVR